MWPALSLVEGLQSRWEDHDITGENNNLGVILSIYCFSYVQIEGRLFYRIVTAHSPVRHISDLKTHFKLKKPTLT